MKLKMVLGDWNECSERSCRSTTKIISKTEKYITFRCLKESCNSLFFDLCNFQWIYFEINGQKKSLLFKQNDFKVSWGLSDQLFADTWEYDSQKFPFSKRYQISICHFSLDYQSIQKFYSKQKLNILLWNCKKANPIFDCMARGFS